MSLPGAAELFRATGAEPATPPGTAPVAEPGTPAGFDGPDPGSPGGPSVGTPSAGRGTGRVRHEEKITVYVSGEELLALEQARLTLRARHRMAVDRGRIVREAVAAALADLDRHGAESELVRRLEQS